MHRQGMLHTDGDAPGHAGDNVRLSPHATTSEPLLPHRPSSLGMKSIYSFLEQSYREVGVIQRVSHLRPDNSKSEHVTGTNRKPRTYLHSKYALFSSPHYRHRYPREDTVPPPS